MSTSVRRRLWIGMLGAAAGLAALSGAARAQSTDNDGCSNATLQGDYAFTIHIESTGIVTSAGQVHFPTVTSDGVSVTKFDGKGGLTQVDFVMRGGVPREPSVPDPTTGFFVDQSGTYTVFPDCTGNFEIDFHTSGQVIKEMFVLASQGREIRAVVNEQQVTDGTFVGGGAAHVLCDISPTCDLLIQARSDGIKRQPGLGTGNSSGTGLGTGIPSVK